MRNLVLCGASWHRISHCLLLSWPFPPLSELKQRPHSEELKNEVNGSRVEISCSVCWNADGSLERESWVSPIVVQEFLVFLEEGVGFLPSAFCISVSAVNVSSEGSGSW